MRRIAMVIGAGVAALALFVGGLVGNTLRKGSVQVQVEPRPVTHGELAGPVLAEKLAALVRIQTVSEGQGRIDGDALAALHARIEQDFPRVHTALSRRSLGNTLIYTWRGSDPSLPAGVLLAHQDVVPVTEPSAWTHPPFAGVVADGFVWGRGTIDDKQNIVAQLAAIEALLDQGFQPRRTVHLVFGHDEEMGGGGAKRAAEVLGKEPLDFVLDEGGMVSLGVLDGLQPPAALIGISEKGYASLELRVLGDGGHSSMPPPHTAVGKLSQAIVALEAHPLPPRLDGPTGRMFDTLGPEMDWPLRLVMANRWLLGGVVASQMAKTPSANATLRTTQAVTMVKGSNKDNILPQSATAVVNYRIVPGDTTDSIIEHVQSVVGPDVGVKVLDGTIASDPSPVSRTDGPAWEALNTAVRQTWPDAVVSPFLFIGATDARSFAPYCERVWRFSPMALDGMDLKRIHGADERISIDNLERAAAFYVRFLETAAG